MTAETGKDGVSHCSDKDSAELLEGSDNAKVGRPAHDQFKCVSFTTETNTGPKGGARSEIDADEAQGEGGVALKKQATEVSIL